MHTISVEVQLPDDLRERFEERVRAYGGDQRQYVREVLERDLKESVPHAGMTFRQILAHAAGPSPAGEMSDEELTEFVEAEVKAYRAEKRSRKQRG